MLPVADVVLRQYEEVLKKREIPLAHYTEYKKWLRYFLDFCTKHMISNERSERVRLFLEKLREKKQTEAQRQRAAHAVALYFEMQRHEELQENAIEVSSRRQYSMKAMECSPTPIIKERVSQYSVAGYEEKSSSPEWDTLLAALAAEIKVRHYSRKTLKTYAKWSRQFQRFLKNKPPQELSTSDVKEYLTFLAVKCRVAASTQNQAFNSLLFLFRHALKQDFGELRDVPRAKKSL